MSALGVDSDSSSPLPCSLLVSDDDAFYFSSLSLSLPTWCCDASLFFGLAVVCFQWCGSIPPGLSLSLSLYLRPPLSLSSLPHTLALSPLPSPSFFLPSRLFSASLPALSRFCARVECLIRSPFSTSLFKFNPFLGLSLSLSLSTPSHHTERPPDRCLRSAHHPS